MWEGEVVKETFLKSLDFKTSPALIYDIDSIKSKSLQTLKILHKFPTWQLYFSMKASRSPIILQTIASLEEIGIDVSSVYELQFAKTFRFKEISATGPSFNTTAIEGLSQNSQLRFYFDSMEQIRAVPISLMRHWHSGIRISVPSNLSRFDYSRFGLSREDIKSINQTPTLSCLLRHVHVHFEMTSIDEWKRVVKHISSVIPNPSNVYTIDFGGGLINLAPTPAHLEQSLSEMNEYIVRLFPNIRKIIIEPGDFLVINAGFLKTTVVTIKQVSSNVSLLGVDSSPWSLAPWTKLHVINLTSIFKQGLPRKTYRIFGNTLFEGDWFMDNSRQSPRTFELPTVGVGDSLLFSQFGAYTMSTYRPFHLLPAPKEFSYQHNSINNSKETGCYE